MTRSRILRVKFIIFLSIFLLAQCAICNSTSDSTHRKKRENNETPRLEKSDKSSSNDASSYPTPKQNSKEGVPTSADKTQENKSNLNNLTSNPTGKKPVNSANSTINNTSEKGNAAVNGGHTASLNAGAIRRGFYVLIGLSVLAVAYFIFRSFRVTKTRAQMIRKYGILAHRQDVEMRPLPLDEDDEDDTTVFDVSNMPTHNTLQTRP